MGSALALVPKKSSPVYSASKAALHSFAQSLRMQLRGTSIAVFEVVPDLVDTAMTNAKKITPEALAKSVMKGIKNDKREILIGRTAMLFRINRFLPKLARYVINK